MRYLKAFQLTMTMCQSNWDNYFCHCLFIDGARKLSVKWNMGEARRRGTYEERKANPKGLPVCTKCPVRIYLPKRDGIDCKLGTTVYKGTARGWIRWD